MKPLITCLETDKARLIILIADLIVFSIFVYTGYTVCAIILFIGTIPLLSYFYNKE